MVPDPKQQNTLPENLNMDFSKRLIIETAEMDWLPSPAPGVRRKPLERLQKESGHTTSIVKYAPETSFASHSHPLGEEIFVLEGVFSDESGDYPAGSYLRNPPGSRHAPFSKDGCVIFVKLNQFASTDLTQVRLQIELKAIQDNPEAKLLHKYQNPETGIREHTWLRSFTPGEIELPSGNAVPAELLVIEGRLQIGQVSLHPGSWFRTPNLASEAVCAEDKGLILIKAGHLPLK